jgi:hypothetical protein
MSQIGTRSTLLDRLCKEGRVENASTLLYAGCVLDMVVYNSLIHGLRKAS